MEEFDFRSSETAAFTFRREERESELSQPSGHTAELDTAELERKDEKGGKLSLR